MMTSSATSVNPSRITQGRSMCAHWYRREFRQSAHRRDASNRMLPLACSSAGPSSCVATHSARKTASSPSQSIRLPLSSQTSGPTSLCLMPRGMKRNCLTMTRVCAGGFVRTSLSRIAEHHAVLEPPSPTADYYALPTLVVRFPINGCSKKAFGVSNLHRASRSAAMRGDPVSLARTFANGR